MHRTGYKVTLFDADPNNDPIQHIFHAPASTKDFEYNCLKKVMKMVESKYEKGIFLHRCPSAKDRNRQENQSSIFVVEWKDFIEMEAREIQDVFRHRHILVRNWPEKTLKFDRAGLSMLGPMHRKSAFQGEYNHLRYMSNYLLMLLQWASSKGERMCRTSFVGLASRPFWKQQQMTPHK